MDNYRRKPPMEGFSRQGHPGGGAFDDDAVEGHMMDDRDELQGDASLTRRGEDDTEGHKLTTRGIADEDDTEGHKLTTRGVADDDTEGHVLNKRT